MIAKETPAQSIVLAFAIYVNQALTFTMDDHNEELTALKLQDLHLEVQQMED